MLTILVKGNRFEAAQAAAARAIPFTFHRETDNGETIGRVATFYLGPVTRWFCGDRPDIRNPRPAPIGSCLFYTDGVRR